ncbi:MAG: sugar ABC transporter permease, partial [Eubacteriales bacterium]|nr:sugar ABC transporter permease [Eubacteriales bacterium]
KVYLMQNAQNSTTSEVISTYVYKQGLIQAQYSYSSAVGLFNSAVNFVFLMIVNFISAKLSDTSLF